jgi:hypothetical protein
MITPDVPLITPLTTSEAQVVVDVPNKVSTPVLFAMGALIVAKSCEEAVAAALKTNPAAPPALEVLVVLMMIGVDMFEAVVTYATKLSSDTVVADVDTVIADVTAPPKSKLVPPLIEDSETVAVSLGDKVRVTPVPKVIAPVERVDVPTSLNVYPVVLKLSEAATSVVELAMVIVPAVAPPKTSLVVALEAVRVPLLSGAVLKLVAPQVPAPPTPLLMPAGSQ